MARSELLNSRDFRLLWSGDAAGQFGAQLAGFIIPIFAVQVLHASEMQMGYLNAAESAAFLVIGLPVGAWVDRMRKRRVMIVADIIRASVLAALVVMTVTGNASFPLLIVVALAMSVCNTFFDVSYQSFVPAIAGKVHLVEANSKLEATHSVAYILGPALGGLLIKAFAPISILGATVVTYLVSATTLGRISHAEELPPAAERQSLVRDIKEGLAWVLQHRVLRRIVAMTAISNLFNSAASAIALIFILRLVDIPTGLYGIIIAVGSAGGLIGAVVADRITLRIGTLRVIPIAGITWSLFEFLTPASGFFSVPVAAILLAVGMFATNFCTLVYNIAQVSYRQRVCPPELLGRMNASVRFIVWGVIPIGSLLGGWLGSVLGPWPTLWVCAIAGLFSVIPVLPALWGGLEGQAEIDRPDQTVTAK